MKNYIFGLLFLMITLPAKAQNQVIPTPLSVENTSGQILFENGVITINKGALQPGEFDFFSKEFKLHGLELKEVKLAEADISVLPLSTVPMSEYRLSATDKIEIVYMGQDAKFHGLISLLQLIEHRKGISYIRHTYIKDAPAFSWRGLHLDVSRHFFTVDEVKRFLDLMALYKFNTFHWHLTDDQGWRIQIDKYPKLTSVGAFRDSTVHGHYSDSPRTYDHERYGGFYTKEEIREVVKYAADLHINVVPEIEMPGHSRAALAAYPELSCTGKQQGVEGLWGVFDDIYCSKESSIQFMQDVLDEVLELFPSEYIHIGGDEAPKTRWNECPECARVMEEQGLHDTHELQSYFIGRMDEYLTAKGRKLIGWDEILEGGLSPNAAVMSWRGEEGGIEAAKQNHFVVMSPTTYCYFDYYQSSHAQEPLAIGGYLPLEKVYQFSPVPRGLTEDQAKYILGGQANVWTEYIPDFDQVEYMVYPRALALIQSLWCKEKPAYEDFLKIYLDQQEDYLKLHDVNVAPSVHFPKMKISRSKDGIAVSWSTSDNNEEFELYRQTGELVGSIQTIASGEAIEIKRNGLSITQIVELKSQHLDNPIQYTFHPSYSLGANVEIDPAPHPKYNHNGSLNLVDGIRGSDRWKGTDYLGFTEKKISIKIDLGVEMPVNELSVGLLNNNGSWIYLPENITWMYSTDGEGWNAAIKEEISEQSQGIYRSITSTEFKARYIMLEIVAMDVIPEGKDGAGNVPWTFIDEIEIR